MSEIAWPIGKKLCTGAEAVIYRVDFMGDDAVMKMRIEKKYRAPEIDEVIRHRRTQMEALLLHKVKNVGVRAPYIFYVDLKKCSIVMEYVDGLLLKNALRSGRVDWREVARQMGEDVGKIHEANIVHGDLTTSNVFCVGLNLVYFDFGLGEFSRDVESKAVDLELLYRVMHSTHHEISERFMNTFLKSYKEAYSEAPETVSRFRRIRLMGRYVERERRRDGSD